jgi:hypothetical protein
MPRRKRTLSDNESVDLQDRVDYAAEREHSPELAVDSDEENRDNVEPEFYNICCCTQCAILPKPSVRKMSMIERHVRMYGNADLGLYEVRILPLILYLRNMYFHTMNF